VANFIDPQINLVFVSAFAVAGVQTSSFFFPSAPTPGVSPLN
jgi:hypothetical protein